MAGELELPRELVDAAFSIDEIGGLYPEPVKTDRGYHLIKLTAKRPALQRSFEEVRAIIEARFRRERRREAIRELVDRLRDKASVEIDIELLNRLAHAHQPSQEETE